jgi:formylglycine-generating enzyme required for sulfatase activity
MGSPEGEPGHFSNETQHSVTLTDSLYVCRHEVTQSEWLSVMEVNDSWFQGSDRPVEEVTWFDAVQFCNSLSGRDGYNAAYRISDIVTSGNHIIEATVTLATHANGYRLLTEAEWEYACRASSTTAFCNGGITGLACNDEPNLTQVGWYCGNAAAATHDVEGKSANAWGLKDMHGNVQEWVWDWYAAYPAGPVTDPAGPDTGSQRIQRGGSWLSSSQSCRSAVRTGNVPGSRDKNVGLRLAKSVP